jgi:glutamate-1-semialdehyde 2,1-aminomutase
MSAPVERAHREFADRNPASRLSYEQARAVLPGGHTRTVLTHAPFPLTFVAGEGATLTDADGHTYLDLLGDYSAGLLGHSERRVLDAVTAALQGNMSVGGIHPAEANLARLMCARFQLDRVRFTNSGTEANLMALTTARVYTGRSTIIAIDGGYHGGVLSYAHGPSVTNAPYDVRLATFNDAESTVALIDQHADDLAAFIVEPMLGSGGCLPAAASYIERAFAAARRVGAVCIADEVMTSRHGPSGLLRLLGSEADITTFGKYIGGGFSFGAFGGRAELLDLFDTGSGRSTVISHAGTFNNNIATMTAGGVVLGEVFTADVATAHTARGDDFRKAVAAVVARHRLPLSVTGYGSMLSLHAVPQPPTSMAEADARDLELHELVFFGLLARGVYTAPRGMITVGLAHSDDQFAAALEALDDCLAEIAADPR